MCLTIPKRVIEIIGGRVIVEDMKGNRQEVKTIVDLNVGDFCLTQQGVVVQKMDEKYASEILNLINNK